MNTNTDSQKKPLILVADDDITVRMIARECLEESGFAVAEAENGREAVELCSRIQPDTVMLDVQMPEMDGYAACREIRAMTGNENLPILMITALEDVKAIDAAYEAGATEFTAKPINWAIEVHRLRSMLRAAAMVKQVFLAKQEWERTFNALDETVMILDADMAIIQANDAAKAAVRNPMEAILGRKCADVFCATQGGCANCPVAEVVATGKKKVIEQVNVCMEGTFLVSVFPIFDDTGNLSRIVYMAKDITERQQLEAEVRRVQKMEAVGTLSAGLAHDFNNLLQVIMGYSEIVSLGFSPEDKAYKHMEAVKDAAWRGSEITRQLLTVSRKTESRKECLMLNGIVESVVKLLGRTIPKMISLDLDLEENLSAVSADAAQIDQILMNLAVNARHAMPQGGKLSFETRNVELDHKYCRLHPNVEPGAYVQLSVADTGCGMDEETLSHIFEPFFTTRSPDKGTGLGLAMVYGIVQKHDGHLLCYSEEGEGTVFKIYLPVFEDDAGGLAADLGQEEEAVGGNEAILVVDDVAEIRHIAKKLLSNVGYRVLLADDGQNALDVHAAVGGNIDFVILDLNMPVMGGLECLDNLRKRDPELSVLLASGFAQSEEIQKRLADNVDFIGKPYHEKEFLRTIRRMLDQAGQTRSGDKPRLS
ncbi:MAG: response regulator [Verrucomicrobiota bacterium]